MLVRDEGHRLAQHALSINRSVCKLIAIRVLRFGSCGPPIALVSLFIRARSAFVGLLLFSGTVVKNGRSTR